MNEAALELPESPIGLVVFAHGSGSGRFSPRNGSVARSLREAGLGTLLIDLLTEAESADRAKVFDVRLLSDRLSRAVTWVRSQPDTAALPTGLFGASTGAAAALMTAAGDPTIQAVVSRGGRPDLAGGALATVTAPTLLIVGGADTAVVALNQEAFERLPCEKELAIIPGATHLFEEPGALHEVALMAGRWFRRYLPSSVVTEDERSRGPGGEGAGFGPAPQNR